MLQWQSQMCQMRELGTERRNKMKLQDDALLTVVIWWKHAPCASITLALSCSEILQPAVALEKVQVTNFKRFFQISGLVYILCDLPKLTASAVWIVQGLSWRKPPEFISDAGMSSSSAFSIQCRPMMSSWVFFLQKMHICCTVGPPAVVQNSHVFLFKFLHLDVPVERIFPLSWQVKSEITFDYTQPVYCA